MNQTPTASASRVGQPRMKPLFFEGKRYEQVVNGQLIGQAQRTGLMAIYDSNTDERLKVVKIYDVLTDPRMEADVQDVFFKTFELRSALRDVLVENERGKRFAYRIDDGQVSEVP